MNRMFIFLLSLLLTMAARAQEKSDVVLKVNGDELKGKVLEIADDVIKFSYTGETLVYTIKKADILKITFSTGRVEQYNKPALPSTATGDAAPAASTVEDRRNKVAILPFTFMQDGQVISDEMGQQVQDQCFDFMSRHAGVRTILPPRRTNVLLNKAGITKATILNYTMDEICKTLGVEFIVNGVVSRNQTGVNSYQSGGSTSTDKTNKKGNTTTTTSGSGSSTTTQSYSTTLELHIYNDEGKSIYNQNRQSLLNYQDSYKSTLEYLLKRCPLYSK